MKVEVEKQPGSVSTLQIELPPEEVSKEWDAIATSFARFAKIPGYRPGKAPRGHREEISQEIQDELTKSWCQIIMKRSNRNSCALLRWPILKCQLGEDKSMRFARQLLQHRNLSCPNTRTFRCNCRKRRFPSRRSMLHSSACAINPRFRRCS